MFVSKKSSQCANFQFKRSNVRVSVRVAQLQTGGRIICRHWISMFF